MHDLGRLSPFNSALETGIRSATILLEVYPAQLDLQRIVKYDYLVVHSEDAGGPPSLHPALPLRSGELLVRRGLIESGLKLAMSRGLVVQNVFDRGFYYQAGEISAPFLDSLISPYLERLRERARWVASQFSSLDDDGLAKLVSSFHRHWSSEFYPTEGPASGLEMFQ